MKYNKKIPKCGVLIGFDGVIIGFKKNLRFEFEKK
jgi:hypothetical protein